MITYPIPSTSNFFLSNDFHRNLVPLVWGISVKSLLLNPYNITYRAKPVTPLYWHLPQALLRFKSFTFYVGDLEILGFVNPRKFDLVRTTNKKDHLK